MCVLSVPGVDGFTNQPWMLDPKYLKGLSSSATDIFRRFVELYGPYIVEAQALALADAEAEVEESPPEDGALLRQQPKL